MAGQQNVLKEIEPVMQRQFESRLKKLGDDESLCAHQSDNLKQKFN